eukprot:scaffold684_cov345-Pavlova_lutheri.AAC.52
MADHDACLRKTITPCTHTVFEKVKRLIQGSEPIKWAWPSQFLYQQMRRIAVLIAFGEHANVHSIDTCQGIRCLRWKRSWSRTNHANQEPTRRVVLPPRVVIDYLASGI